MSSHLTKGCLTFEERPLTPPEVRKYRRSTNLEPGKRFTHYGVADDLQKMNLSDKIFGQTDHTTKTTASDLINHSKPTELQRINMMKSESTYKTLNKEPLGRSPDRKMKLPSKFTEDKEPFGEKSKSSVESAKELLFPMQLVEANTGMDLYKRSHGSYAPGEQKHRDYKWNINPEETRFGRKGDTIAFNGVSANIYDVLQAPESDNIVNLKKVEDFRNMGDILGQSKNLGQDSGFRPPDMVYGKKNPNRGIGAAEVMKGKYTERDNAPDKDLGKSIMPGFRNISLEDRAYGCPSIRNDIPTVPVSKRSLADSQNYGDDVPAQDLINPPAFSDLSIDPLVMQDKKTKSKIIELFERIGYKFTDEVGDSLFYKASKGSNLASINDFRNVLNEYLLAEDLYRK